MQFMGYEQHRPKTTFSLASSTNKTVPVMYTLVKDASTLLEDEAIISIGTTVSLTKNSEIISNAAIGELNGSEVLVTNHQICHSGKGSCGKIETQNQKFRTRAK